MRSGCLRDPSGGFPCWYTSMPGSVSSAPTSKTVACLEIPPFTVNWSYIAGLVAHAGLQVRDTALNEVSEVQAGERLRFSRGSLQRSMEWNPVEIAHTAPLESADEAVDFTARDDPGLRAGLGGLLRRNTA